MIYLCRKNLFLFLLSFLIILPAVGQVPKSDHSWADSVIQSLSLREQIGQLFMVAAWSDRDENHRQDVENLIRKYGIGGVMFLQGGPSRQWQMTRRFQQTSKIPLLIAIDAEWGLAMRLDSTIAFPYQMTLGAIQNDSLIEAMGRSIARQCQALGVHVNFAPVADVNNNPQNPVISYRAFGENRELVTQKALAYMRGLEAGGLMGCGKHFPGHGDTDVDSHKDLPVLTFDRQRLDSLELYPFRQMIDSGLASMMIAHLEIPSLDDRANRPASLSQNVIEGLLREELGFEGLIFTDAMTMKGVTKYYQPGEADLEALMAGNDIVLMPENVPAAVQAIEQAIAEGLLSPKEITAHCHRLLVAKEKYVLGQKAAGSYQELTSSLNDQSDKSLAKNLLASGLTVLRRDPAILPIPESARGKVLVLGVGDGRGRAFTRQISRNRQAIELLLEPHADDNPTSTVSKMAQTAEIVVVGLQQLEKRPLNKPLYSPAVIALLSELAGNGKTIFVNFRNPYTLDQIPGIAQAAGLVLTYQGGFTSQQMAADLLLGKIGANGKLPVSVGDQFSNGEGIDLELPK